MIFCYLSFIVVILSTLPFFININENVMYKLIWIISMIIMASLLKKNSLINDTSKEEPKINKRLSVIGKFIRRYMKIMYLKKLMVITTKDFKLILSEHK